MRDLRDPECLGAALLKLRRRYRKRPLHRIYDENADPLETLVPNYQDGDFMSADPAHHHLNREDQ